MRHISGKKSLKLPDHYTIYTSLYKALYLTIVIDKKYYKDEHFIFHRYKFFKYFAPLKY